MEFAKEKRVQKIGKCLPNLISALILLKDNLEIQKCHKSGYF
jgi:hypothetical protein